MLESVQKITSLKLNIGESSFKTCHSINKLPSSLDI